MNLVVKGYLMRRENSEREKKMRRKKRRKRRSRRERERKKRENDFLTRKGREDRKSVV